MTPLTAEKIAELERLLAAATAGPWVTDDDLPGRVYSDDATGSIIAQFDGFMYAPRADGEMSANTHLAAAAVNALPALLSIAKRVAGAPVGTFAWVAGSVAYVRPDDGEFPYDLDGKRVALVEIVGGEE
jgi:hypothetical protein